MKICTYNIWNSEKNFNIRLELLVKEINDNNTDIIALQEVKDDTTFNYIKAKSTFENGIYYKGLGFLSNYDIKLDNTYNEHNNFLLRVSSNNTSFTNIHLDWEKKENRVKGIDAYFDLLEIGNYDNEFLLGDFNDIPEDNIHYDLIMNDFCDIHKDYTHSINKYPMPTLDMLNNPRWRNTKTDEQPSRCDWIMLNTVNSVNIKSATLIGIKEVNSITPSDHYGVMVDIDIEL